MEKVIIAIPARLESQRLPNKVLADINNKTMLKRVYDQCSLAKLDCKIVICTDSYEIIKETNSWNGISLLTSKECSSGTERIASVIDKLIMFAWDLNEKEFLRNESHFINNTAVINVQGDQPFLDPEVLNKMIKEINNISEDLSVLTPVYKLKKKDIHNQNVVKTLLSNNMEAIYFSRTALPFVRDQEKSKWHLYFNYWGHVGIYGFKAKVLKNWFNLPVSQLEKAEKLEQLKFIDAGIKVKTFETKGNSISIDTAEQLAYAIRIAELRNN